MAKRAVEAGLVLVFMTMLWAGATPLSSNCSNVLINLGPCLAYITENVSAPSSNCCRPLATVVQSSPECLCEVAKAGGSSLGFEVNQTRAMGLPDACNVQTTPLSRCNAASPSDSPTGTSSDGSSIKTSLSLLVFLVSAASYISIFKAY